MTVDVRLVEAQRALFWPDERAPSLDQLRDDLRVVREEAYANIPPRSGQELVSYMQRVRVIQGDCMLLQNCLTLLESMNPANYTAMYANIGALVTILQEVLNPEVLVAHKVERLKAQNPEIQNNCPYYLAKELFLVLEKALEKALEQARHLPEQDPSKTELEEQVRTISQRKELLQGQLPAFERPVWDYQAQRVGDLVEELKTAYDASYSFWKGAPSGTWLSYKTPFFKWYIQTGLHGVTFEKDTGQIVGGLQKKIEATFQKLMRLEYTQEQYEQELNRLLSVFISFNEFFDASYNEIFDKEPDALYVQLLKYANFVRLTLYSIRNGLLTLKGFATQKAFSIFAAMKACNDYHVAPPSWQKLVCLFTAAKALDDIVLDIRENEFLVYSHRTAKKELRRAAQEDVALDAAEQGVWERMMHGKAHVSEECVQSYTLKRIIEVLYLTDIRDIDVPFELFIHTLKQDPAYQQIDILKQAIEAYDRQFARERNSESLAKACELLSGIFSLEEREYDLECYVRIFIRCTEFTNANSLSLFLFARLDAHIDGKYTPIKDDLRRMVATALYGSNVDEQKRAQEQIYKAYEQGRIKALAPDLETLFYLNTMRKLVRKEKVHKEEVQQLAKGPIAEFKQTKKVNDRRLFDTLYTLIRDERKKKEADRTLTRELGREVEAWFEQYERLLASSEINHAVAAKDREIELTNDLGYTGFKAWQTHVKQSIELSKAVK